MAHPNTLIQLDADPHPSVFDAMVAIDSNVDHLLQYGNVEPSNVLPLVHGAMFTRGPEALQHTAIFVGGSNVEVGDSIGGAIAEAFFGPIRVSVMLDGNGSNTTAAAAVLCAARHVSLSQTRALVLGGTGPVGRRVAQLLLRQGAQVRLVSRQLNRAQAACDQIFLAAEGDSTTKLDPADLQAVDSLKPGMLDQELNQSDVVFGCGAAGVELLSESQWQGAEKLQVAIDLNAVPPAGLAGVAATDKARLENRGASKTVIYGAIGVGGLKMKIHRDCIQRLFTRNDLFLSTHEIFEVGQHVEQAKN